MELVQLRTGQRTRQQDQAGPEPAGRERAKDAVAQLQLGRWIPGAGEFDDHCGREPEVRGKAHIVAVRKRSVQGSGQLCESAQPQHVQGDP